MFDFAWSEIALIGAVALVVIGPKDLPVAIRGLAKAVKKARGLASEFQSHVDEMVREADLSEVRDHVRDFRNLNVRGRLMKAIDADGSLARTFESSPLDGPVIRPPAGPRALDAPPMAGQGGGATPMLEERSVGLPSLPPSTYLDPDQNDADLDAAVLDAPPELPPGIVRRIAREREYLFPPAIIPPVRVLHGGARVMPGPGRDTADAPQHAHFVPPEASPAQSESLSEAMPPNTSTTPTTTPDAHP